MVLSEEEQKDRNNQRGRARYNKVKESFNEKRRAKYLEDSSVRQKALDRNKKYREENKSPESTTTKVLIGGHYRSMYSPYNLGLLLGCSVLKVRTWVERGWIPKPYIKGRNLLFSKANARGVKELFGTIDTIVKSVDTSSSKKARKEKAVNKLHKGWEIPC